MYNCTCSSVIACKYRLYLMLTTYTDGEVLYRLLFTLRIKLTVLWIYFLTNVFEEFGNWVRRVSQRFLMAAILRIWMKSASSAVAQPSQLSSWVSSVMSASEATHWTVVGANTSCWLLGTCSVPDRCRFRSCSCFVVTKNHVSPTNTDFKLYVGIGLQLRLFDKTIDIPVFELFRIIIFGCIFLPLAEIYPLKFL